MGSRNHNLLAGVLPCGLLLVGGSRVVIAQGSPAPLAPADAHREVIFGKNFVLFPVTTALQRELLKGPADLQVYAILNGRELTDAAGMVDPAAIPMEDFLQELRKFPDRKIGSILVCLDYSSQRLAPEQSRKLAAHGWAGIARSAGFRESALRNTYHNGNHTWQDTLNFTPFLPDEQRLDGKEEFVSDQRFAVAPVRTVLSEVLTNNASCVVTLKRHVTAPEDLPVTPESVAALKALIDSTGVKQRRDFLLRVTADRNGPPADAVNSFIANQQTWASLLGFESMSLQW